MLNKSVTEFTEVLASKAAEKLLNDLSGDEKTGAAIVAKALKAPIMQIAANAGLQGAVILDKIVSSDVPTYGFDAAKEEFCDMIAAGIILEEYLENHRGELEAAPGGTA